VRRRTESGEGIETVVADMTVAYKVMRETFASRVSGSQLNAIGLSELVTDSLAAYEVLALRLATELGLLNAVRRKLAANIDTAPLFDTAHFCKHIEAAYRQMWDQHRLGKPPASFTVEAVR
jgi:hypothetical protein